MPTRKANAQWNGDLQNGNVVLKFNSGLSEGEHTFASRFENSTGTNPEELIGAAHAGCFDMALSNELAKAGYNPRLVDTQMEVTFNLINGGPAITGINLVTEANVPGIDNSRFQQFAKGAKGNHPVSKALAKTEITLVAALI